MVSPFAEMGNAGEEGRVSSPVQFPAQWSAGIWETSRGRCSVSCWIRGFSRIHCNLHPIPLSRYPNLLNPQCIYFQAFSYETYRQHLARFINSFSLIHFLYSASRFLSGFPPTSLSTYCSIPYHWGYRWGPVWGSVFTYLLFSVCTDPLV